MPACKRETLRVIEDDRGSHDIGETSIPLGHAADAERGSRDGEAWAIGVARGLGEDSTLSAHPVGAERSAGDHGAKDLAAGVPEPELDGLVDEVDRRRVQQALLGGSSASFELGRYVITGTLGRGGMGVVYKAFDPPLDRRVALKVLHKELDEQHTIRLRREAQAMAKLSHPNVVQVYEVGTVEGRTFVAMELVRGQTLRRWMRQRPRPSWRQCVEVFVQVGKGLAAAHDRGLVHRDFKPGNAIIDDKGRPRVLDFGLARKVEKADLEVSTAIRRLRRT
ncbi:MAG: serine/threonine protein kinase, partial [Myxococcales bacterium]|nr:serine/threonine protein kinase [Myxococcales bacterium]